MLTKADVVLWDEGPMSRKDAFSTVDRLFRDLTDTPSVPFGGKTIVLGGDFRQTLPVVPHQGRSGIVSKTVLRSSWWPKVRILKLHINERVRRNGDTDERDSLHDFY